MRRLRGSTFCLGGFASVGIVMVQFVAANLHQSQSPKMFAFQPSSLQLLSRGDAKASACGTRSLNQPACANQGYRGNGLVSSGGEALLRSCPRSFRSQSSRSSFSAPSTLGMVLAGICEDERDYRQADIIGTRLFVTGLPSSVDDVRLYLAFEEYGRVVEAQVAKPGLGFVVFEDLDTADTALAGMEGEEISGKEVKVKRARSFYIRKEEEARLKLAQAQRERESRTAALAEEQSRRVRMMEEAAYANAEGLSAHARSFDIRLQRRVVLEEMRAEGLLDLSRPMPHVPKPQILDAKPVRPVRGATAKARVANGRRVPKYIDSDLQSGRQMMRRSPSPSPAREPSPSAVFPQKAFTISEEERIKKQAMIEIMKEGDKLSKNGMSDDEPVNIAQLIRERVEQIKRYEMLRDNRELLGNITFSAYSTQNVRTTGIPGYHHLSSEEETETDTESEEVWDEVVVTEAEEALVNLVAEQSSTAVPAKPAKTIAAPKRKRGRPRKTAGKSSAYVPTGRPRGRPRKNPVADAK